MRSFLSLAVLCLFVCNAQAAERTDFAYGYTLEVDGDGAIYSVDLPEDVYRGLTRADRGDLRVFNSQGVAVPHYVRRAEQLNKQSLPEVALPLFPLYAETNVPPATDGYNVHITTNDKGAIIDINYGKGDAQMRRLNAYLIDASQLEHRPNAFTVQWPQEQGDFVATLKLEYSDDLSHWRALVARSTLSNLHYGAHTLIQQRIELPVREYKYLRMTWQGTQPFELSQVLAQFPEREQAQERKWSRFDANEVDTQRHYYYYDTQAVLPADRLNITLPQRNTLTRTLIESAQHRDGPWTHRYNGLLYDLHIDGNQLSTPDIRPGVTTHRYWRVQLLTNEGQLGGAPQLRLGWMPEQLLFVAQGEAPFLLAYGSGRVETVQTPLPQLMGVEAFKQQELIKAAQLGSSIELGDASRLETPRKPADWKRYSLWSILFLGVALLAWMALRLYKEMDTNSD